MKIIKDNFTKSYRCTCPNCTSIFEFDHQEIINEGYGLKIYCPLCRVQISLASNSNEEFRNVTEIKKPATKKVNNGKTSSKSKNS